MAVLVNPAPIKSSGMPMGADGIGYCNITKCCTQICPEQIRITDNAIIPLKERVMDDCYDPLLWLLRKFTRK